MKNIVKSLAVMAAAVMVLGLGVSRANASGVNFSVGLNLGVPVVAAPVIAPAPVYASAPVYAPRPVPAYRVERVRYYGGNSYRPVVYGYGRYYGHDRGWHRGWDRDNHGR